MEHSPNWEKNSTSELGYDVHVWRCELEKGYGKAKNRRHLLDFHELEKMHRFKRIDDQKRFLISKVLRKDLISAYLGIDPESLVFTENDFHKPILLSNPDFHFNISHSGKWVMFVFAKSSCGIDVEYISPGFDFSTILPSSFSSSETEFINNAKNPSLEFFRLWTSKESFLKATGDGLSEVLTDICCLEGVWDLPLQVSACERTWYNMSFQMGSEYFSSITIEGNAGNIRFFEL